MKNKCVPFLFFLIAVVCFACKEQLESSSSSLNFLEKGSDEVFCKKKRKLLIDERKINNYAVLFSVNPKESRNQIYKVDIDEDGVKDELIVSSGSNISYVQAILSSSADFDIEFGFIRLLIIDGKYYIFETIRDINNINILLMRNLYLLDKSGIQLICRSL
ncbi:MAG: hypothetical protein COA46_06020 [Porticoccaceae bacterium]|nr:MAG: hypothetical protein COA46_06020 [Porticoccaceae bacterium]